MTRSNTGVDYSALPGVSDAAGLFQASLKPDPKNLFAILERYKDRFVGQDGNSIDMDALKQRLAGKYVTLNFGLEGCSAFCPLINQTLAKAGEGNTERLASVVINLTPESTRHSQHSRDAFLGEIMQSDVRQDVFTLYPDDAGTTIKMQQAFMGLARRDDPTIHPATILVHSPDGSRIREADGMQPSSGSETIRNAIVKPAPSSSRRTVAR